MLKIEYEIKLNEQGRPCIELSEDYENKAEDKFFAIELARYFLQGTHSRMTPEIYDQNTIETMDIAIRLLGQIGDEMAEIQYGNMKVMGELALLTDRIYHFEVSSIEERDNLPLEDYFACDNKLYKRQEGLRVYVLYPIENWDKEKAGLYELRDGINNENWIKLSK